jgi:hypothetical protein
MMVLALLVASLQFFWTGILVVCLFVLACVLMTYGRTSSGLWTLGVLSWALVERVERSPHR